MWVFPGFLVLFQECFTQLDCTGTRFKKKRANTIHDKVRGENSDLNTADWVEVRSEKEISGTLDSRGKLRGLCFTPEMIEFYGRRFKVYKILEKILLETTRSFEE